MIKKNLTFLCLLVLLVLPCMSVSAYLRTNELKLFCENDAGYLFCAGYINGITDTLLVLSYIRKKEVGKPYVCFPEQFSTEQAMAIAKKHINAHPEDWHKPARVTVLGALTKAFKCSE